MDGYDGYLSDVPTHHSVSPSEVSHDLIASTKTLEQHFKDKYAVLRSAYESRIKRMADTINGTCKTLLSDEIIEEMKHDRTTSKFVVAHATEILDRHLESDREAYISELLDKLSHADILLKKKNKDVLALREAAAQKEKEHSDRDSSNEELIQELQAKLQRKEEECNKLRALSERRERDIDLLEQSFNQSTHELALIEGMEKKEQIIKSEMKEQLRSVTRDREFLTAENHDLKMKLQTCVEEIDRLQKERAEKKKEEDINHQRITELMAQVEQTLEQEANESNLAISTVHEKMKSFRNRLVQELQKEKRLNSLLQEELNTIKTVKDDSMKSHRRLQEEEALLRSKLIQEQEKVTSVQHQLVTAHDSINQYKLQLTELDARCRMLEDRLSEQGRGFQQEMKVREEAIRIDTRKSFEQEQRLLEHKTAAFRLHYENEISKLNQTLRSSKEFVTSPVELGLSITEDLHLHEVIARMRHDRDELLETHHRQLETQRKEFWQRQQQLENQHKELWQKHQHEMHLELRKQEMEYKSKYEKKLDASNVLLAQAGQNIDKLKAMVKEGRAVISLQNQRIEHLKKEYEILQRSLSVGTSPSKHRGHGHNHHRVAFVSTVYDQPGKSRGASTSATPSSTAGKENHDTSNASMSSANKSLAQQQPVTPRTPDATSSSTFIVGSDTPMPLTSSANKELQTPQLRDQQSLQLQQQQYLQLRNEFTDLQGQLQRTLIENQKLEEQLQSQSVLLLEQQKELQQQSLDTSMAPDTISFSNHSAHQQSLTQQRQQLSMISAAGGSENFSHFDGFSAQHPTAIVAEALEEARLAKMRCLELENEIAVLREQLEKAEKASAYLNTQRNQNASLVEQCGLMPPSTDAENRSARDNDHDDSFTQDTNVSIPNVDGLVQLQERLEQSLAISKHWEERYTHQTELLEVTTREVAEERQKHHQLRQREIKLFRLLTQVHETYRSRMHELRMELQTVRSIAESFKPFAANEAITTLNQFRFHFKNIFDLAVKKQEKEMKDLRISMQSSHNTEISILESKFIEQVNALNQRHTKELEKMHNELLTRTERALNASMCQDATAASNILLTSMPPQSRLSQMTLLTSTQDVQTLFQSGNSIHTSNSSSDSSNAGSGGRGHGVATLMNTQVPAFESVLRGVLQGLQDQDAVSPETTEKVLALSQTHQEPSFAANAAARALLGDEIDRFVVTLLERKYALSPKKASANATILS